MAERIPTFEEAYAAHLAGDYVTAERGYLALSRSVNALQNLGILYSDWGRLPEAEGVLRFLLREAPHHTRARHSLGMVLIGQGRFEEGWALYETRLEVDPRYDLPKPTCPEWKGEPLAGKTLCVVAEQGFGDQLLWSRFVPMTDAARTVYVCTPNLVRLFARAGIEAVSGDHRDVPAEADYWVWLGSLPHRLGVTLETLPPPLDLRIPRRGGDGIGLMVTGRPENPNDRNRSLAGRHAERALALGRNLAPEATGARDFAETAEIIAGLDLVIAVDTAVAHLAGTMGVPTWVLVPAHGIDWRWMRGRTDSPWYPGVRLFRQSVPGDWDAVLDEVETALTRDV